MVFLLHIEFYYKDAVNCWVGRIGVEVAYESFFPHHALLYITMGIMYVFSHLAKIQKIRWGRGNLSATTDLSEKGQKLEKILDCTTYFQNIK